MIRGETKTSSSQREVRVNEGSSYQASTVFVGSKITGKAFKLQKERPKLLCGWLEGSDKATLRYPMPFWLLADLHRFFFFSFFFSIVFINIPIFIIMIIFIITITIIVITIIIIQLRFYSFAVVWLFTDAQVFFFWLFICLFFFSFIYDLSVGPKHGILFQKTSCSSSDGILCACSSPVLPKPVKVDVFVSLCL